MARLIEFAPTGVRQHEIEAWPLVSALGAADAGVAIDLDHLAAAALGDLGEFVDLVLKRLVVCADAHIQRGPFHLFDHCNPVYPVISIVY
jgi:hypothetical protein